MRNKCFDANAKNPLCYDVGAFCLGKMRGSYFGGDLSENQHKEEFDSRLLAVGNGPADDTAKDENGKSQMSSFMLLQHHILPTKSPKMTFQQFILQKALSYQTFSRKTNFMVSTCKYTAPLITRNHEVFNRHHDGTFLTTCSFCF